MPLLIDKYKALEEELIPLLIKAIEKNDYNAAGIYPIVHVTSTGIRLEVLNAENDSWSEKIIPAFNQLFQSNNIPLVFGHKDYISVTRHYDHSAININVSLIALDRLLESKCELYQVSRKKNALYEKGNPLGIDGFLPFNVIEAINNTIFEKEGYPIAYLDPLNNAFCLVCEANVGSNIAHAFSNFYLLFEGLCKKHNIQPLKNSTEYATMNVPKDSNIVKYKFNISPTDIERLLLLECANYAGYRGSASINRLVAPASVDIKEGVICLFPVLSLNDEDYMPRQAGCNMSEIISVQLANYIKNYLLINAEVNKKDFFGHHNSRLTEGFLMVCADDILFALAKCMNISGRLDHQIEDGTRTLKKSNTPAIQICNLDECSMRIYQRHAVVTHDELNQLQSGEVPVLDFLDNLTAALKDKISRKKIWGKENASCLKYAQQHIKEAQKGILKINCLKTAIIQGPLIDDIEDIVKNLTPKPKGSRRPI